MKYILVLVIAFVTMYGPTGNKMANGKYPHVGAVACPRRIKLGTTVSILGTTYVCSDRTSRRYDGRFDIYSEGTQKEMLQWGKKKLDVKIY